MSLRAICQRCQEPENHWQVSQAEFHVREMQHWKVQLCERCAIQVQMALRAALLTPLPEPPT